MKCHKSQILGRKVFLANLSVLGIHSQSIAIAFFRPVYQHCLHLLVNWRINKSGSIELKWLDFLTGSGRNVQKLNSSSNLIDKNNKIANKQAGPE